jgi:hypothetical protein
MDISGKFQAEKFAVCIVKKNNTKNKKSRQKNKKIIQ